MKRKYLSKILIPVLSTALVASAIPAGIVLTTKTQNIKKSVRQSSIKNDATYTPVEIDDSSLNANVIGCGLNTLNDTTPVDAPTFSTISECAEGGWGGDSWYTESALPEEEATGYEDPLPDPDDKGVINIQSISTAGLNWNIKNVGVSGKNNSVKIFKDSSMQHASAKINLKSPTTFVGGAFYLLATGANTEDESPEINITLEYEDESTSSETICVDDWCDDESENIANTFSRYSKWEDYETYYESGVSPSFGQYRVNVDPSKALKSLTISIGDSVEAEDVTIVVYAITGAEEGEEPEPGTELLAPQISIDEATSTSASLSWQAVENAIEYEIDYTTDSGFATYDTIKASTNYCDITGLEPGKTYYVRGRSVGWDGSSDNSEVLYFTTIVAPTAIELTGVPETAVTNKEYTITHKVIGETIGGKTYDATNQNVKWHSTEGVTISQGTSSNEWKLTFDKCGDVDILCVSDEDESVYLEKAIKVLPNKPANLVLAPTDYSFTATWTDKEESGSDKFIVTVATDAAFEHPISGYEKKEVTTNSITVTDLDKETDYYVKVCAVKDDIESEWISGQTKTTFTIPTNIFVAPGITDAHISWDSPTTCTNWELEYSKKSDFSEKQTVTCSTNPETEIDNLEGNTTYYIRIRCNFGGGTFSGWSNTQSFKTYNVAPTGVELTGVPEIATRRTQYDISHKVLGKTLGGKYYDATNQKVIWSLPEDVSIGEGASANEWKLTISSIGKFTIKCASEEDPTKYVEKEISVLPLAPEDLSLLADTNSFEASWDDVEPTVADNFIVTVATDSEFANPIAGYNRKKVSENKISVTNLYASTQYFIRVSAVKNGMESEYLTGSVTTKDPAVPPTPVSPQPEGEPTTSGIKISWQTQPNIVQYEAVLYTKNEAGEEVVVETKILDGSEYETVFDKNIVEGTTYFFKIRGKTAAGVWSNYSSEGSVVVPTTSTPNNLVWEIVFISFAIVNAIALFAAMPIISKKKKQK